MPIPDPDTNTPDGTTLLQVLSRQLERARRERLERTDLAQQEFEKTMEQQ